MIHQFSGANAAELEATLKLHGSVVPSQSNPPPSNKSPGINLSSIPTSSFSLIPQRGWIQFDAAKPEMILQKLQDSSTKLSSNDVSYSLIVLRPPPCFSSRRSLFLMQTTKNQALTAVEGRLLLGLCNTVKKMDSQLLAEQMKLPSAKLLRWPTEMLWPVVDLLRLLVLHPQGSQFVAEHALKDGDEFNCVDVVLSFLLDEPQKELAMMCWRFICNLFATPALQHSAVQIIDQIASIAQLFISDPTPAVRSHVAAALLNSAVAALATRANNETRTSIAEACICLLKQEQDATNVDRLLAALGTACYGAEHILEKHLSSLRQLPLVAKGTSQAAQEFTKFAKL